MFKVSLAQIESERESNNVKQITPRSQHDENSLIYYNFMRIICFQSSFINFPLCITVGDILVNIEFVAPNAQNSTENFNHISLMFQRCFFSSL